MSYRIANSINVLCNGLRGARPGITLGTIRDVSGGSDSDHNPWLKDSKGVGVVRAVDIMGAGADYDLLAKNLGAKLGKHPAMKHGAYVIHKQRIISADRLGDGWRSMEDRGSATANHMDHVHVSVTTIQSGYDYAGSWGALFSSSGGTGAAPTPLGSTTTPTSSTAAHQGHSNGSGGTGNGQATSTSAGAPSKGSDGGLDVDGITELAIYAAALSLGAVLIAVGAIRLVKPTSDSIQHDVQGAALAAFPPTRAAGVAAGAAKTGAPA